jgi:sugar O-acyltransferase (sialic acid O-acetyltransferase NeuD family)
MKQLVIIGAGGFGREVFAWAEQADEFHREWTIKGFIDDDPTALDAFGKIGAPILGNVGDYRIETGDVFICAIGNVAPKRRCVETIRARGGVFTRVTHRTAVLGQRARLGAGVILCPRAVVSCDAALGDFVSINLHSTVAHDATIGDFTQVHCHADITGGVHLGRGVLVGSHASILPGVRVGDDAIVGAGSVVVRDVPAGATVFGNPAKVLPRR